MVNYSKTHTHHLFRTIIQNRWSNSEFPFEVTIFVGCSVFPMTLTEKKTFDDFFLPEKRNYNVTKKKPKKLLPWFYLVFYIQRKKIYRSWLGSLLTIQFGFRGCFFKYRVVCILNVLYFASVSPKLV